MPRIPMADKAGMIQHVNGAVHMQGAPGLNWKLEEGQSLINMGEKIGRGMERLGNSLTEYFKQKQDTEDKLNATQIESIWRDKQSALLTRMAQNPADYEKFAEWARETDADFADAAKPYREKMSSRALELFDARMDGIRKETYNTRERVGIQAGVTADYNLLQEQCKDAGLRGDMERYNELLEAHRGKLISEQEYQQKKIEFANLSDLGAARTAVEANQVNIEKKLDEKKDGKYVNFPNLTIQQREQLRRTAVVRRHEAETNNNNQFLTGIIDGSNTTTPEELKASHDRGEISDSEYIFRDRVIKNLKTKQESAAHARNVRLDQLREKRSKAEVSSFLYDLEVTQIPSGQYANSVHRQTLYNMADDLFSNNPDKLLKVRNAITKKCDDALKEKDLYSLPGGAQVMEYLEQEYRDNNKFKNLKWDPDGWEKDNSQHFMKAKYYEILTASRDMLMAGEKPDKVIEFVKERVGKLNDGKIYNILSPMDEDAKGGIEGSVRAGDGGYGLRRNLNVNVNSGIKYRRDKDGRLIREEKGIAREVR